MPLRFARHAPTRRLAWGLVTALLVASACTRRPEPARVLGRFSIHEWGLIGMDIRAPGVGAVASSAVGDPSTFLFRSAAGSYKPVIYVHLDEGVREASFSLTIGIGGAHVPEHYPSARLDGSSLAFGPIRARLHACPSDWTSAVPTFASAACAAIADGYCEAPEIPRYYGDRDTCLRVDGVDTDLLFYRASALDVSGLPLLLVREGTAYALRSQRHASVEGPVLFIENDDDGPRLRLLDPSERSGRIRTERPTITPAVARAALIAHARSLGLHAAEADALVDAWAPVFFDRSTRLERAANGAPPVELQQADVSLLYFAPRSLVDAMLPLTTDPPSRAIARAFLVRLVDGSMLTPPTDASRGFSRVQPGPPETLIELDHLDVQGALPPAQAGRVVFHHLDEFSACYARALRAGAAQSEWAEITATISAAGAVTASRVANSGLEPRFGTCLRYVPKSWTFPIARPEGTTEIRFDVRFAVLTGE